MDKSTLGVYHGRRVPTPSLANARPFARRHPTRRNPVPPLNTPASPTIGDVFALLVGKGEEVRKGWRDRPVLDVDVGLVFHDFGLSAVWKR